VQASLKLTYCVVVALLFTGLLASCTPFDPYAPRLEREYDWDKPGEYTPVHRVWVIFPDWLVAGDRPEVLKVVDACVTSLRKHYPWSKTMEWDAFNVYVHNNPGACVSAPPPCWCLGWMCGYDIVVCWGEVREGGRRVGIACRDCLPALAHEFMHTILQERFNSYGHELYDLSSVRDAIAAARAESPSVVLDVRSVTGALEYDYQPWTIPGYRE